MTKLKGAAEGTHSPDRLSYRKSRLDMFFADTRGKMERKLDKLSAEEEREILSSATLELTLDRNNKKPRQKVG